MCFSTSEVFGRQAFRSSETDDTVMGQVGEARWIYAVSKLAEEHLAMAYHREHSCRSRWSGRSTSTVRGRSARARCARFVMRGDANQPIEIHGDGTQIRAWCYVDDMVDGVLLAMAHPNAVGESFNIGNQHAVVTIYGLANTVVRVLARSRRSASPARTTPTSSCASLP